MSNVITLNESNFEEEVLRSEVPVIIDYWAPWCRPCRVVGPVIEEIANERAGSLKVGKVNVDEQPHLAAAAGVHGIPFIVLYHDGQPAAHVVGAHPKHTIELALELDSHTQVAA